MTTSALARSYFEKARKRRRALHVLLEDGAYSDVVREAQELVELALKGMLRAIGIEPPKLHDVGGLLVEHRERFAPEIQNTLADLARISKELRKERELALYGDVDFIPTDEYSLQQAEKATITYFRLQKLHHGPMWDRVEVFAKVDFYDCASRQLKCTLRHRFDGIMAAHCGTKPV